MEWLITEKKVMYVYNKYKQWPDHVRKSLPLNNHILDQEVKSCWINQGYTAINIMLLKNIRPNVHVHAKYQKWIWFQKYINLNGTRLTIILTILRLLLNEICFSCRSSWNQRKIYLKANPPFFIKQKQKRRKTSIREQNDERRR